jgi:hypothetical protein
MHLAEPIDVLCTFCPAAIETSTGLVLTKRYPWPALSNQMGGSLALWSVGGTVAIASGVFLGRRTQRLDRNTPAFRRNLGARKMSVSFSM